MSAKIEKVYEGFITLGCVATCLSLAYACITTGS